MSKWLVRLERTVEATEQAEITVELDDEDWMTPAQRKQWAIDKAAEESIYLDGKQWHEVDADPRDVGVLWAKELDS